MSSTTTPTLKQNLAVTTTPSHTLHLREVPTPTPGANECLIHVRATGICGSYVHFWKEGGIGDSKVEGELGLGHESAGVVVQVGDEVRDWEIGEFLPCSCLFRCEGAAESFGVEDGVAHSCYTKFGLFFFDQVNFCFSILPSCSLYFQRSNAITRPSNAMDYIPQHIVHGNKTKVEAPANRKYSQATA